MADDFNWSENPEIVRAHIMGDDPNLEAFAYLEEPIPENRCEFRGPTGRQWHCIHCGFPLSAPEYLDS